MSTPAEQKRKLRDQWSLVASGWERWFDWSTTNFQPLTTWCCDAAELADGDCVLDLASGAGLPALSAAGRVRPQGSVVATDISPEMLQVTERRARAMGLDQMAFREMDAEALAFADHSFDAVTFACGLMFCPDPARAVAEIRRVLKPGGRFAIAVWDHPSRNAFFSTVGRALVQVAPLLRPAPTAPNAFRFASSGAFEEVLRAGGLTEITMASCAMTFECASVDEYLEIARATAAGLQSKLESLSTEDLDRFYALVREGLQPYQDGARLRLPATALCASGRV